MVTSARAETSRRKHAVTFAHLLSTYYVPSTSLNPEIGSAIRPLPRSSERRASSPGHAAGSSAHSSQDSVSLGLHVPSPHPASLGGKTDDALTVPRQLGTPELVKARGFLSSPGYKADTEIKGVQGHSPVLPKPHVILRACAQGCEKPGPGTLPSHTSQERPCAGGAHGLREHPLSRGAGALWPAGRARRVPP